jgi:putative endonuclease
VNSRRIRGAESFRRGLWAETLCLWVLRLKGYRILARRYRSPAGEIDLIVKRGAVVAAIEVKARADRDRAGESVLWRQRARIVRALENFLAIHPRLRDSNLRFDVMLVAPGSWPRHIRDAWRPEA